VYAAARKEHFGLGKASYTHFTSPIRRYPDLIVHRILGAGLSPAGRSPYARTDLGDIARSCSATERLADEAERALIEIKKYRLLEQEAKHKRGRVHDAVVVEVTNYGLFVELLDLQIQGLVHVSAISDRFVRYSPKTRSLKSGSVSYRIGDSVSVSVGGVDTDKRRLDLVLE
jgi:ribonuclease R